MSIGSEVYFYMLARITHNGWFSRHDRLTRDGLTRRRRPASGPVEPARPRVRGCYLCVTWVYFLNSFTGLGLGLVRGSHAVGLVPEREARLPERLSRSWSRTRISRSGAVAQRASRSAQGHGECPARGRHRGDRRA